MAPPPAQDAASGKPFKRSRKVVVDVSLCRYAIIKRCLKDRDFRLVRAKKSDVEWDIWWSDRGELLKDARRLNAFQKVNHFPSMEDICRKDFLANNLYTFVAHPPILYLIAHHRNAMRKLLPDEYDFFPRSFLVPAERVELQQCMDNDKRGATYIHNPLLIDGFKFDLRIYVLVVSVDPLVVYVFRNGLARFCTTPFQAPKRSNLHQTRMHLTKYTLDHVITQSITSSRNRSRHHSYAINKKSKDFVKSVDESTGSKRSLAFVMQHLQDDHGMDPCAVWADVCDIVLKTLLAIQPRLAASYRNFFGADDVKGRQWGPAAFEILGFDIMLDEQGKAWMVEVNHAPSFAGTRQRCSRNLSESDGYGVGDSVLDRNIKTPLIAQALDILAVTNETKRSFQAAWKTRLWNATVATKKAKGVLVEPPPPVVEPQVVELAEEDAVEPIDNDGGGSGPSEDEKEDDDTPAKAKTSSSNRVHPDSTTNTDDNNQGREMETFGNTYELIYPPPAYSSTALHVKYARILAAADTNRSKLWG
ncbi:hypothetical protein DYB25_008841 [Aphanomyces astaci]|uniref:Tubulin--tyrosine ligase-like protein 9 n=1 Tax=Aphanomyces astaci TaxID=112090 RepID=A0A397BLY8_APHAT|nr:hypothetical protein DYB25_008841 [Aphanomyces astaci]